MVMPQGFELNSPPNLEVEDKTEEELAALAGETDEVKTSEPEVEGQSEVVTLAFDPDDISGSLNRMMQQDPKVLNVINAMVGQKAASKWQPQVSALQLELDELRAADQKRVIAETPKETVQERLATDPGFRRTYDDLESSDEQLAARRQQQSYINQFNEDIELATSRGLSYEAANGLLERVAKGEFDVDSEGNVVSLPAQLTNFRGALFDAIKNVPIVAPTAPISVEDALDTAEPDISPNGGSTTGGPQYTKQQVELMDPVEFELNFPDQDSYMNAIKEGRVSGFSEGVPDVYR